MEIELSEVFEAYFDCRKGKRNTFNASCFEENLESNIIELHSELCSGTYKPGRHVCFVITHPSLREIWAADFRDRVVQTLLYNKYREKFHRTFIYDSYACIPDKGTLRAAQRLDLFCRKSTQSWSKNQYFLKADIANFFVGIDKDILFELLCKRISDSFWRNLTQLILFNDPKVDVLIKGNKKLLEIVPKRKSLFHCRQNKGLPVGNLTSQFFANIYLNELDQYVKHHLKEKYYLRYVDDFVIVGGTPSHLNDIYQKIDSFIQENLGLSLHSNKKRIAMVSQGIDFVGFTVKPYRTLLRDRVVRSINRKVDEIVNLDQPIDYNDYAPSLNSYIGILGHVAGHNKKLKISQRLKYVGIEMDKDLTKVI
jgi:retron-type reverse transcriptase